MNWNSAEGRALLWRAWPEGALWTRGVRTMGGWTCVREDHEHNDKPELVFVPETRGRPRSGTTRGDQALAAGLLLPNPDPSDVATWACLLADLADRLNVPNRPNEPNLAFHWGKVAVENLSEGEPPAWCLWVASQYGWTDRRVHRLDADDPILALILALIQTREATDARS